MSCAGFTGQTAQLVILACCSQQSLLQGHGPWTSTVWQVEPVPAHVTVLGLVPHPSCHSCCQPNPLPASLTLNLLLTIPCAAGSWYLGLCCLASQASASSCLSAWACPSWHPAASFQTVNYTHGWHLTKVLQVLAQCRDRQRVTPEHARP